ncbi:hypothetical protein SEPCBS119000_005794 [Sporothrix epigloea]|uniref:Uncharacterized protein n=1 Tax=Sporothrix epigloea TaxID=1892477 RepID=A0ABP0E1D0_9PEZI
MSRSQARAPPTTSASPIVFPDDMPSFLKAALPASIQSRIPKMPLLRRTASMQGIFSRSESTSTLTSESILSLNPSSSSSACSSPPPSRPSTSAGTHSRQSSGKDASEMGLVLATRSRPSPPGVLLSDVQWKYAQNGFHTLQNALREASDPDRVPELERQIYVESISYLLRGLPNDLQEREVSQLRSAAPQGLLDIQEISFSGMAMPAEQLGVYGSTLPPGASMSVPGPLNGKAYTKKRSLPHIATHWLVTKIYTFILLLIPLAASFARWAIEMERKYRVPEAALSCATAVLLMLYRNSVELYVAVCDMGDGSVGRALDDGTVYLANGVVAGFREAVFDMARGQK